ncbi:MAG: helix-turn-helix domain-containing protein [Chloroflexota bacterium]|nr:helix-turn-helix domain-containing protein [Chloroflexota bacterium]
MPRRTCHVEDGRRRADQLRQAIGRECRNARLAAGLSLAHVGEEVGCAASEVWRIEQARAPWLRLERAAVLAAVLGLDLTVRTFPSGPPLRDAAHLALIQRLRRRCGSVWRWRTEVPLPIVGDRRALDILLSSAVGLVGIEAETALTDRQALVREIQLKQRDAAVDCMILLVLDSARNRAALRSESAEWHEAFPATARTILKALAAGAIPPANGILLL